MDSDRSRATLRQIQAFVAVADAGSYRRAAEQLGTSQPTLTNQVANLEASIGLRLFDRSRAGTLLTPNGRELLPNARHVIEEHQGLLDRAASLARGPAATYRLGVTPTLGPYLLPLILPSLHQRHAALKLSVREGAPRQLEEDLVAGRHDLILSALPIDSERLSVAPLFQEPVFLAMSSEHPLADRSVVAKDELAGEAVLTLEEQHHFHTQIQSLCDRLGAHVRRDYEGTSLDTLRHMVTMDMGIAFLPALYIRSEIHNPNELHIKEIKGERVERTHALAWRRSSPGAGLFREIAELIRDIVDTSLGDHVRIADDGAR